MPTLGSTHLHYAKQCSERAAVSSGPEREHLLKMAERLERHANKIQESAALIGQSRGLMTESRELLDRAKVQTVRGALLGARQRTLITQRPSASPVHRRQSSKLGSR
jgi:hypothetical protein